MLLTCFCSVTTKTTMHAGRGRLGAGLDVGELAEAVDALVVLRDGRGVEAVADAGADEVADDGGRDLAVAADLHPLDGLALQLRRPQCREGVNGNRLRRGAAGNARQAGVLRPRGGREDQRRQARREQPPPTAPARPAAPRADRPPAAAVRAGGFAGASVSSSPSVPSPPDESVATVSQGPSVDLPAPRSGKCTGEGGDVKSRSGCLAQRPRPLPGRHWPRAVPRAGRASSRRCSRGRRLLC